MNIGFDISQTGALKAGCGHFARALVEAMLRAETPHRFSLYPSFGDFYFDPNMPERNPYPFPNATYGPQHVTLEEARAFWNQAGLDQALGRPDIVHSNNFWCPTQLRESRLVYTLHDLSFLVDASWTTELNRKGCWEGASRAAQHADWIAAVSKASRDHFLHAFPDFPADRMRVIHPCSRFEGASTPGTKPATLGDVAPQGYWLSVGTIEPRKNQRRVAEAYARWRESSRSDAKLVFAGGHGWLMDDFRDQLQRLGLLGHVIVTGYVSDEELLWLYRNCIANLYMSHFEGFGLPVLEGMQFGAPTIASNTTSIPEVAGDAAILLAPEDSEAVAQAMLDLSRSREKRAQLSEAGRQRAARFTSASSATAMLQLYEEAKSSPKRRAHGDRGWAGRLLRGWRKAS